MYFFHLSFTLKNEVTLTPQIQYISMKIYITF